MFTGIPVDRSPLSDAEAREVLASLMSEYRALLPNSRLLCELVDSRSEKRITGAWDVVPFAIAAGADYKKHPHFTIGLRPDDVQIQLTIGNQAHREYWRRLASISVDEWISGLEQAQEKLSVLRSSLGHGDEPRLIVELLQRHFLGQIKEIDDADLRFDVASVVRSSSDSRVKHVSAWIPSLQSVLRDKESANFQFQVGVRFNLYPSSVATRPEFPSVLVDCTECLLPLVGPIEGSSGSV
jgi:hypothetical protein